MRSQPLLLGKTKNYEWLDLPQRKYVGSLNGSSYNKKKHTHFPEKLRNSCDANIRFAPALRNKRTGTRTPQPIMS